MTSNRPPRKVRSESDVMNLHFASLSRARKANQMEDRRHAMHVEDQLTSEKNYELATMERERKRIQRDLAALQLHANKDDLRRRQVAMAREVARQQEIRDSLVPSPLPIFPKDLDLPSTHLCLENSHLMRKERRSRKVSVKEAPRLSADLRRDEPLKEPLAVMKRVATTNVPALREKSPAEAESKRKRPPVPCFKERISEARKARYIRSQDPVVRSRERELTADEIFDSK